MKNALTDLKIWWFNKQGWAPFRGSSCKNCHHSVQEHKYVRSTDGNGIIIKCSCGCSGDVLTIADEQ